MLSSSGICCSWLPLALPLLLISAVGVNFHLSSAKNVRWALPKAPPSHTRQLAPANSLAAAGVAQWKVLAQSPDGSQLPSNSSSNSEMHVTSRYACSALVALDTVQGIVRRLHGHARRQWLAREAMVYLQSLLEGPLDRECSIISLTGPLGRIALPGSYEARDTGSQNFSRGAAHPRVALVHMANSKETLLRYAELYTLWILTHWAYARAHGYTLLLHCAFHHLSSEQLGYPYYFFLKALALRDTLFGLDYEYALYLDWDTVRIGPLFLCLLQSWRTACSVARSVFVHAAALHDTKQH